MTVRRAACASEFPAPPRGATTKSGIGSVGSVGVGSDFGLEDEGPFFPWLPPEDRLWRHPSEAGDSGPAGPDAGGRGGLGSIATWLQSATSGPGRLWTVAIVAGVIGAMAASGVGFLSGAFTSPTTVVRPMLSSTPEVTLATVGAPGVNWAAVNREVSPSVVAISVSGPDGPQTGSGLLLINGPSQAYVVTDRSLIGSATDADDLGPIGVTFSSGKQAKGTLVGQDPLSGLAVIAVPDVQDSLPSLGSVSELAVANSVMAMGAQSLQGGSVFPGAVAAENQVVNVTDGTNLENLIAVSGTPAPAVAGGPLVDQYGQVVGITVDVDPADATGQNVTFAVPVDEVKRVAQQIVQGEKVTHPWLGLYDSVDSPFGALAVGVTPNSPASRVGLAASDVITSLNGHPVTSAGTLTALLSQCQPSDRAQISFIRDGKTVNKTVVVSNQPDNG
jgi:putative serine protease PepD